MPTNLLSRVRGSGVAHFKGLDLWGKVKSVVEVQLNPWEVRSDAIGPFDMRQGGRLLKISMTEVGTWALAMLAVTHPYALFNFGDFNTPVRTITNVNTATGVLTSPAHGQVTATGVRLGALGVGSALPTGIAANTTVYMNAVDGNSIKLYDTEAHAIAGGGTGLIIPSTAGVGTIKFIVNSPLTITTEDGMQLVCLNAAVSKMASMKLTTTDSAIGAMEFECYTVHGLDWKDANSLYLPPTFGNVITAVPPNSTLIPSVPYTIDWATALPASGLTLANHSFQVAGHNLASGAAVQVIAESTNGVLPAGLTSNNTTYFAIVLDGGDIQLSDTQAHAIAGTNIIAFTDVGTGTIEIVEVTEVFGLQPRDAISIDFAVTWSDVNSDRNGLDCRSIKEVSATVKFTPTNLALTDLLTYLNLQGAGAARGQSLPSANMDIYGPNYTPFIRLYGAALQTAPINIGTEEDRVGELTFKTKRTFRGTTPNPIFSLGVAAPTS